MKKFLPVLFTIMIFTGFLAGQVYFDLLDLPARPSKADKKIYAHHEGLFYKLSLKDTTEKVYDLKKLNERIVILNFWASWCIPCIEEFPSLVSVQKKYKDKLLILGINTDEEDQMKSIKKSVKKNKLNFPIIADKAGKILDQFLISGIPYSIIYVDGKVHSVSQGSKDFFSGEMVDFYDSILRKK